MNLTLPPVANSKVGLKSALQCSFFRSAKFFNLLLFASFSLFIFVCFLWETHWFKVCSVAAEGLSLWRLETQQCGDQLFPAVASWLFTFTGPKKYSCILSPTFFRSFILLLWCRVALEFELNNIFCTKLAQNLTLNCAFVVFLIYEEFELLSGRGFNLNYVCCLLCRFNTDINAHTASSFNILCKEKTRFQKKTSKVNWHCALCFLALLFAMSIRRKR